MMSQEHIHALREQMAESQGWANLANAAAFLWGVVEAGTPLSEEGTETFLRLIRESMAAVRTNNTQRVQ
uniref:Uncharacterized protein n=1 Tax=Desulfovibrio sp. U5L TaxID=596152 RepID=I2Q572_9BACT